MSHGECSAEATACLVAITNSITDTMSKLEAIGSMTEHAAGLTVMGSNEIDEKIAEAFYEDPTTPAKAVVRKLETEEVFPTDENELFDFCEKKVKKALATEKKKLRKNFRRVLSNLQAIEKSRSSTTDGLVSKATALLSPATQKVSELTELLTTGSATVECSETPQAKAAKALFTAAFEGVSNVYKQLAMCDAQLRAARERVLSAGQEVEES